MILRHTRFTVLKKYAAFIRETAFKLTTDYDDRQGLIQVGTIRVWVLLVTDQEHEAKIGGELHGPS